jgi:hypothetical protein
MRSIDNIKLVMRDAVAAAATGFTTTTNGVNMANYNRCRITLLLTQSGAGTATVTLKQGTTTTVNTALAFTEYWKNEAGSPSDDLTRVAATTLTTAGAGTGDNIYIFEIKAEDLTKTSANKYIRMNVASISNNTAAALFYELYDARYPADPEDLTSAAS